MLEPISLRQARALIADPDAAACAPASARRLAWNIALSARGGTCRQRRATRADLNPIGPGDAA